MSIRFMGVRIWVDSDREGRAFIVRCLPHSLQRDFVRWLSQRGTELKRSEGKSFYRITQGRGQPLELTISRVGGFSLEDVRQYYDSLSIQGAGIGFTPIQANDPKIEVELQRRVSMSLPWDFFEQEK